MACNHENENECGNDECIKTDNDMTDDVKQRAEDLKEKANDFFKSKNTSIS